MNRNRRVERAVCCALACALPGVGAAQSAAEREVFWSLAGGVEHTDNVARRAADGKSETIGVGRFDFTVNTDRPRLDARIAANLQYRDYLDDTYKSEVVGGLDGEISYALIPERLIWVITDNFGQIATTRAAPDSPDNRQDINYFTTGPEIILPLGSRSFVQLSGRYTDTYYENTLQDSQSISGSLALVRRVSDISSISINGSTAEVEYKEDLLFSDYRIDQAYLRWSTTTERASFLLDAGYTTLHRDERTDDGLLARLQLSRAVAARSRIFLDLGTEFTTTGQAFRRDQSNVGVQPGGANDAVASSDPYQLDYAYLTWRTDWERSAFSVVLNARSESHEIDTIADRDIYGAAIVLSRQLSRRLDADVRSAYAKDEFRNAGFSFDEWSTGLGLSWLLSDRVAMSMRVDRFSGSSSTGARDYEENRAYVGFSYSRRGS